MSVWHTWTRCVRDTQNVREMGFKFRFQVSVSSFGPVQSVSQRRLGVLQRGNHLPIGVPGGSNATWLTWNTWRRLGLIEAPCQREQCARGHVERHTEMRNSLHWHRLDTIPLDLVAAAPVLLV